MTQKRLPKPNSKELTTLVKSTKAQAIYAVLHQNMDRSLSMAVIRDMLGLAAGEQEHLNRRLRELYGAFKVDRTRRGSDTVYRLVGLAGKPHQTVSHISTKVRAWVLRDQRCVQCGRTPAEDGVKLHVDHKIPQEWGGTDDPENLQALCSECNEGKKNLYSSYNDFSNKIKQAIIYDEPHKRIGELLKAFDGKPVPSELIEVVAKAKQYQDDWQKRMRELRVLGWNYIFERRREGKRVRTFYKLTRSKPWPKGSIRAEITKREQARK